MYNKLASLAGSIVAFTLLQACTSGIGDPGSIRDPDTASLDASKVCPESGHICIAVEDGDIDGDGKVDQVGFSLGPVKRQEVGLEFRVPELKVQLSSGSLLEKTFSEEVMKHQVAFVGIYDVNRDKKEDIFLIDYIGAHAQMVRVIEHHDGQRLRVRGGAAVRGLHGSLGWSSPHYALELAIAEGLLVPSTRGMPDHG